MKSDEVLVWLDCELAGFPKRTSGEEVLRSLSWQTRRLVEENREGLVGALVQWIRLRSEPRTMLAVEIAAAHQLHEMRPEIERLLDEVKEGETFKPHYERVIRAALARV